MTWNENVTRRLLRDLDAVPPTEVRCEDCGRVTLSADAQLVALGRDVLAGGAFRVRLLVPLSTAWHAYHAHSDLRPLGALLLPTSQLTRGERARLRKQLRRVGSVRPVYAARRAQARRLGGKVGAAAERAVQRQYPDGIPARLSVERVLMSCEPARAVFHRRVARLCALGERLPEPEVPPAFVVDLRSLVDRTLEELLHGGKDA